MVEESHPGKRHGDAVLIAALDNRVVPDRTARLGDIRNAAAFGSFNVVAEGEESVRTK